MTTGRFSSVLFKKKKFLLKNDMFLLTKTDSFLGVFLNLHREKKVKYFSTSTLPHET
jgi:hypothetical protein